MRKLLLSTLVFAAAGVFSGATVTGQQSSPQAPAPSKQAVKPGVHPYMGEPDTGGTTTPAGSQLSYWQMVLLGLIQLLPGQRLP